MSGNHHPFGPSRLELRAACPGSYHAELPFWDQPEEQSEDAQRGTLRHQVAADGLMDPRSRIEGLLKIQQEDDRSIVQDWWKWWDSYRSGKEVIRGGAETPITLMDGRHGTVDAWLLWRDNDLDTQHLTVADLKGQPISAHFSRQLADYARGLSKDRQIDGFTLAIVSRAGADVAALSVEEMHARWEDNDRVIAAAMAEGAERKVGPHCRYCLALESCDKRRTVASATAAWAHIMSDPVEVCRSLYFTDRTDMMDLIGEAIDRLTDVRDQIKAAIIAGEVDVPLYKCVSSERKAWANETDARLQLTMRHPEMSDQLTPLCSPSQAIKILGKDAIDGSMLKITPGAASVRRMKGNR